MRPILWLLLLSLCSACTNANSDATEESSSTADNASRWIVLEVAGMKKSTSGST